jgi:hypothetical protein
MPREHRWIRGPSTGTVFAPLNGADSKARDATGLCEAQGVVLGSHVDINYCAYDSTYTFRIIHSSVKSQALMMSSGISFTHAYEGSGSVTVMVPSAAGRAEVSLGGGVGMGKRLGPHSGNPEPCPAKPNELTARLQGPTA